MERKTKVTADNNQQVINISREFELPVELLFKAHEDPELFEQWMSHEYGTTKVVKYETKQHGGWEFQTVDAQGNVLFKANGVFHEFVPNKKITRTFEMNGTPFDVQLEFLEFERLTDETSKLTMQTVFRTAAQRDQLLKMPFAQGLDMAHNRLQQVISNLK
jgi:uncharacterized protein YndB with AHSA1/START domain